MELDLGLLPQTVYIMWISSKRLTTPRSALAGQRGFQVQIDVIRHLRVGQGPFQESCDPVERPCRQFREQSPSPLDELLSARGADPPHPPARRRTMAATAGNGVQLRLRLKKKSEKLIIAEIKQDRVPKMTLSGICQDDGGHGGQRDADGTGGGGSLQVRVAGAFEVAPQHGKQVERPQVSRGEVR